MSGQAVGQRVVRLRALVRPPRVGQRMAWARDREFTLGPCVRSPSRCIRRRVTGSTAARAVLPGSVARGSSLDDGQGPRGGCRRRARGEPGGCAGQRDGADVEGVCGGGGWPLARPSARPRRPRTRLRRARSCGTSSSPVSPDRSVGSLSWLAASPWGLSLAGAALVSVADPGWDGSPRRWHEEGRGGERPTHSDDP